jgi:2-polyprenyl-6-methoxyphenol hydroxylase-like FAD-dependent oxidoreductase
MAAHYDAIVVGARCAGAPTAMLLARKGYRVLLVDRATFPSDTLSTHQVHAPGIAALKRWGLLERLVATGCPPIERYVFDFGPFAIAGSPRPSDGVATAYAPRRTVLDALLVHAAVESGVELREGFTVDGLTSDDGRVTGIRGRAAGGAAVIEQAPLVIGADGRHSLVARAVQAHEYHQQPPLEAGYYAYWSGLPTEGFEVYIRPARSFAAIPTHDGMTCVVATWPQSEFEANRDDIEGAFGKTLEMAPAFAERIRRGQRETRFMGTGDLANFFRTPFGSGWALVGDAGYHRDPCTAQGISDAFRDAELLAEAVDDWFAGRRSFEDAMGGYQQARDARVLAMYELTCELASLAPPPPELAQLLGSLPGNQQAMDGFASVIAGTMPVQEFFAPENQRRILSAAG